MNNDWIIWNGGECPVPGKRIVPQFRDQNRIEAEKNAEHEADELYWGHNGADAGDITAYRLIPEPLWVDMKGGVYVCLRIPMKLIDGKREFDKSRQPEWGEL